MERKNKKPKEKQDYKAPEHQVSEQNAPSAQLPPVTPEVQQKLDALKEKIERFQKEILEKFDKYIMGIGLLPPVKQPDGTVDDKKIELMILVDDSDSTRMPKFELKEKLITILEKTAKDIDPQMFPQIVILSEMWQSCYDGKYDLLQLVAMAAPIFDRGMLAATKIAELHKSMVLKKFEKYIVAYVLAGSLVQGRATKESDIDAFIVIDDTDVKKMTRFELKEKLRAIIIGMGIDAAQMTGVKNKLNVQIYILTDFWDNIREANPVIFTFLRDGIPFYDRGIFMAWKQLLKLGKIKPSPEAIDLYMSSGEQTLSRVRARLRDIAVEDFFWSILTPSQAAIMLYGYPPPTPKETPEVLRELFVKKEKIMDDADVKILERVLKYRKDIEHGFIQDVSGKEIDDLLTDSEKYLKNLKKLFGQVESLKDRESVVSLYDHTVSMLRDALAAEGIKEVPAEQLLGLLQKQLIDPGKIRPHVLRKATDIFRAHQDYKEGRFAHIEVHKIRKDAGDVAKEIVELIQKRRKQELDRIRILVRYGGNKSGEVYLLADNVYVIKDATAEEKEILKGKIKEDGSLAMQSNSTLDEFEGALAHAQVPQTVFLKQHVFDSIKTLFGGDAEIVLHP